MIWRFLNRIPPYSPLGRVILFVVVCMLLVAWPIRALASVRYHPITQAACGVGAVLLWSGGCLICWGLL